MTALTLRNRGVMAAAAPAFSPSDIAALSGWWKADGTLWQDSARTTPATADTNPVGAWDDASGNNRHVLQATAGKRPLLKTAILNGKPVLRFDGPDDFLRISSATLTQPNTVIVVAKDTIGSGQRTMIDGADNPREILYRHSGNTGSYYAGSEQHGGALDTNWHVHTALFNGASSRLRKDGVLGSSGNPGTNALQLVTIGGDSTAAAANCWGGDIAEVLIYNAALTDANLNSLGTYLAAKYGTSWTTI